MTQRKRMSGREHRQVLRRLLADDMDTDEREKEASQFAMDLTVELRDFDEDDEDDEDA
jgi:hypothetical protein